jgi:HPt (histidine-containing phosphotransfer) domain-containing protein
MTETARNAIDIACLNRYTGGDAALNSQILRLFDGQCSEIVDRLESLAAKPDGSQSAKDWHDTAHSLKGAARGVGAVALADIAAAAEHVTPADSKAALEIVERLKTRAAAVHMFIEDLLRPSA